MKTFLKAYLLAFFIITFYSIRLTAQTEFFGMTPEGGKNNNGTIFRADENGENIQIISDFTGKYLSFYPVDPLCNAGNGKVYGVTFGGGLHSDNLYQGDGVIFEWDPITKIYTEKFYFNGTENGRSPGGALLQASNGKLYGTTYYGGANDCGVLFEWDPVTNIFIKKLDFNPEIGSNPHGSLIQAENGKLYGITIHGGINSDGVIFEWDPFSDTFSKKHDFNGTDGKEPLSSLTQANNGKLYGMTMYGGDFDYGVIFELSIENETYLKILDFNGSENGRMPDKSLVLANNGKLYGTAANGGDCCGVLFELDPSNNAYTKKHDFNYIEGSGPHSTLFQAENGRLYGTTSYGGKNNWGVIFEWNPVTEIYNKIFDFDTESNGINPSTSFIQVNSGKLYGVTSGGVYNMGVIFEWDITSNTFTKKYDFSQADNGRYPKGNLVQAHNGKLYGMTTQGGLNDRGTIFELDPADNTFKKKFNFSIDDNGKWPMGSLVQANNGKLYGMTSAGGYADSCDFGVLFEWDLVTDTYAKKLTFNGPEKGRFPTGSLALANNGKLYGMTSAGGSYTHTTHIGEVGNGVLFEWDPVTDTYTKKLDFEETSNGRNPYGSLILANNGKLYGLTNSGGLFGYGILFEWDPDSDIFTKKFDFNDIEAGVYPLGTLFQTTNNKFYGIAQGGKFNYGVLFEYDLESNIYKKDFDFNRNETGYNPCGTLVQGDNGKIYGMTLSGGMYNKGVFFEWDPVNEIFIVKSDFPIQENTISLSSAKKQMESEYPIPAAIKDINLAGSIVKIKHLPIRTICVDACNKYVSPSGKFTWLKSGEYSDTIVNLMGLDTILIVNLTVINSTTSSLKETACNRYISPSGKIWTLSGHYRDTTFNTQGCDSVIYIDLTVISPDTAVTFNQGVFTANVTDAVYQWINCDNDNKTIEGETYRTFTPGENGHYAVIISQNGCIDTSSCLTFSNPSPVINTFKHNIVLYPNPNNGSFSIDLGRIYQNVEISICELNGRIIRKEEAFNSRIIGMQVSSSPGLYLVIITCENEKAVFRISKK